MQEKTDTDSLSQYFEIRSRQINELLQTQDPNPYPHKFQVTYDCSQFEKDYGHLKSGESDKSVELRIGARIYNKRSSGSKLIFYDIRTAADTETIGTHLQVVCQAQEAKDGSPPFEKQHENIRRGDIIGIVGYPGRTNPKNRLAEGKEGELSIFAQEIVLLAPCLHM
jgi:lysyl-tRNA synthetase class 2